MLTRPIAATDRAQAERVWLSIERDLASPGLTCSWAWTGAWLAHYGDVVPHRFVVGVIEGRDVAAALVTRSAGRYPRLIGASQAHIGTAGEPRGETVYVERNRLLVGDEHRDAFAAALVADVERDPRWDRLVIPGLRSADAESFRRAHGGVTLAAQGSPVAELSHARGGDPIELLGSGPQRRARRALKGLAPLETEWAQTLEHGHAIMDDLVELHQRRWVEAGQPGKFASPRFAGFHRALIDRLFPGSGVMLVRVRSEGQTIGCVYGQIEAAEVLFYQSGFVRHPDNRLRVGLAVHVCAMRACAERGIAAYDFLAPPTRYKLDLATRTDALVWATLERNRPRTHVDRGLRALRARRQQPGAAATAARAGTGRRRASQKPSAQESAPEPS